MALEYEKIRVLTPYDRTILPITLDDFALYGDKQGAYDITDTDTADKINKYIDITRSNLESHFDAPLIAEEWLYTAYTDTLYKRYFIRKHRIIDFTNISIKTTELDNTNQHIWYDIPSADWFGFVKDPVDILNNCVEVQSNTTHKALNTNRANENIRIKFTRGVFADVNSIKNDIKSLIAMVAFQMMNGVRNPDDSCIIEAIANSYDTPSVITVF